tara:strand:+ start:61 stop:963 length:903 start_codon:yes stop_codon:yes gene_type:complete
VPFDRSKPISANGVTVVFDAEWGCWRQEPMPRPAEIDRLYLEEYFQNVESDYVEVQDAGQSYLEIVYEDKLRNFNEFLPDNCVRSILDIGCADGRMLEWFQDRNWLVQGIEPSPLAENARIRGTGIPVINEPFERSANSLACSQYSVVHLKGVLEHVHDPNKLLRVCAELTADDGIFCLHQGLDLSDTQKAAIDAEQLPLWILTPEHITYWTDDMCAHGLEKAGFQIVMKEADFPIDWFLLMGVNYVETPELGYQAQQMREAFERNLIDTGNNDYRIKLLRTLAANGFGRTINYYCRKVH